MLPPRTRFHCASALLVLYGCGPSAPRTDPTPDRVLAVDNLGVPIRQAGGDERSTVTYQSPVDKVWKAVVASYADADIAPTVSDVANGRYGSEGFIVPKRAFGRGVSQVFDCGTTLTGATADAGQITAVVVTTLASQPDGSTLATTRVSGTLRRYAGTSNDRIDCTSTGIAEEFMRKATLLHLASP